MEQLIELLTIAIKKNIIDEDTAKQLTKLAKEEDFKNNEYNPLNEVLTFVEVSKKYKVSESALRMNLKYGRYKENEVRQSAKTWLTTKSMVSRLYPDKYYEEVKREEKEQR